MKRKTVHELIAECVASYRRSAANLKTVRVSTPQWERACNMQMDRAAGARDALFELCPDSPAWRDTEWIS